ncbi:DNA gyrase subunit A [Gloeobacter violaceus]|uniref:DNA gyrase subunit A n=1 Tax=Gloeobacter violaceus (strain ATCC 29082 / PCC 7421) TaxID=251221 RepID=Q7NC97_GLOVI|nr:DNA gyrase subunit A [Gloeobacter violaceus]BAC91023.1 DNA gyrase subunit A [Gloeobacter violaceus PCC 7421]
MTTIIPTNLRNEMQRSYLEYAMSVIVGRALPDARDGLKPVHRRILFAMHELGLGPDRPYRKCARVVGDVLGKYHPHGDSAVYDALVRLAQDFSTRYLLIDGHGNFGSVDNDPPAAMRYTECRLTPLTRDTLLADLEAETVDFSDNFDGSQQEPTVLPSRLPQLLLNGSAGIAVGMATNIPPHQLGELVDGVTALLANPNLGIPELMRYIPGPDFPTGGTILGQSGIREAYTTGRGSITMRGVAAIETIQVRGRPDREAIVITELPYQVCKAALIEKIAELVNDKRIDGISDIRDESDRDGLRAVIELKRDAYPRVVLNNLFKLTPLQTNFGCNMLALVNGEPRLLNLKEFLQTFIDFRAEVITRRTHYELRKARERDHILMGMLVALANLESVIALIRAADDTASARAELVNRFELSEAQAEAILQMQLRRLTGMEAGRIEAEHRELIAKIADLSDVLERRERIDQIIRDELLTAKQRLNDPRRTIIEKAEGEIDDADLIANQEMVVLVTEQGYIKRLPVDTFDRQRRATRGKSGARMREDDAVEHFITCCNHDTVLFFTNRGVVYALRGYQIPAGSRTAKGTPVVQLLPIPIEEKVTSIVPVQEFASDEFLVMLTRTGFIKKTALAAFANLRANGLIAIGLEEGDELRWVRRARAEDDILVGSRAGMAIRFRADEEQLRPLGRTARGVKSMELRKGDELVSMDILSCEQRERAEANGECGPWVLVVTADGFGKRVPFSEFRAQNRGGMGVIATKFRDQGDELAALRVVSCEDELMIVTARGVIIRQQSEEISQQSRAATGVRVQRLDEDDTIVGVAVVPESAEDGGSAFAAEEEEEAEA